MLMQGLHYRKALPTCFHYLEPPSKLRNFETASQAVPTGLQTLFVCVSTLDGAKSKQLSSRHKGIISGPARYW